MAIDETERVQMKPGNVNQETRSDLELEQSGKSEKRAWVKPVVDTIVSVDRTEVGFFGAIHPEDGVYSGS